MERIRLLMVDDHQIILDGLRNYLKDDPNFEIIGEALSGMQAQSQLQSEAVDVLLTDISMDDVNGIELTKWVKKECPQVRILVLSMLDEAQYIKTMLDLGVDGYLLKTSTQQEIKEAILTVMKGETYYSKEVTKIVMDSMAKRKLKRRSEFAEPMPLTQREVEVLRLIVDQLSNPEIAEKLFISPRTVDAHKRNLLEKTGAKNVAGLVLFAIENGMLEDKDNEL